MNNLNLNELIKFINGDFNELEYFNITKDNLIPLKLFLEELKEKKETYKFLIEEPLKSIKNKNKWVTEIIPNNKKYSYSDIYSEHLLICSKKESIEIARKKLGTDFYCTQNINIDSYFKKKKIDNMLKILKNSKEELQEIGKISDKLWSNNKIITPSKYFSIANDFNNVYISIQDYILTNISINDFSSYTETLTNEQSKKLINKLYLQKK